MAAAASVAVPSLDLTKFHEYAAKLVQDGRFASAGQVLDAAVDALMREECDEAAKEAWLEEALEDGDASGVYKGDVFADIRARHGLPARS